MTTPSIFAASSISQHQVNITMTSTTVPATNSVSLDSIMSTDDILSESASFEATSLSNVHAVGSVPTAMTLSDLCQKLRALILQPSALTASFTRRLHTVAIGSDLEQALTKELQAHKEHLQMFKNTIDMFSAYDVTATITIMPTTLSHLYVVPDNLPMMQWRGSVFGRRSPVASAIKACLKRFEDTLSSHGLDHDSNWRRLIPVCLSCKQLSWLDVYWETRPNSTWKFFKYAFVARFGMSPQVEVSDSLDELMAITMEPSEPVEQYVYRFKVLRYLSNVKKPLPIFVCFMTGLSAGLHRAVSLVLLMTTKGQRYSVDYAVSLKKINNKASSSSCSVGKRRSVPCAARDRSQPYKILSSNRYCSFHRAQNHSDAQGRALKESKIAGDKLPSSSSGMTRSSWDPANSCSFGHQCSLQ